MKRSIVLLITFSLGYLLTFGQNNEINKERVLDNINGWRSEDCQCGNVKKRPAPEVIWDNKLEEIAQNYADDLATDNKENESNFLYLSHVGTDGSTLSNRLAENGYEAIYCVENIAYLKGNEDMVIDHWMNTPAACNNIMNRQITSIGIARSGDFWVLLFAAPKKKK